MSAKAATSRPISRPPSDAAGTSDATNTVSAVAVYGLVTALIRRAPRDISLTSLSTLATLDRTGPRRITDLAMVEGIAQPSMTALVSTLQAGGFVQRGTDANDKRVALVELTDSGRTYLHARRAAGADKLAQLIDLLPDEQAAALAAAVPALTQLLRLENESRDPATAQAAPPSA
jgi:DNA-binding MarR family transcriptional regulator